MVGVINSTLLTGTAGQRRARATGRGPTPQPRTPLSSQHAKHYMAGPELRINAAGLSR
jgi:hypothetical protein